MFGHHRSHCLVADRNLHSPLAVVAVAEPVEAVIVIEVLKRRVGERGGEEVVIGREEDYCKEFDALSQLDMWPKPLIGCSILALRLQSVIAISDFSCCVSRKDCDCAMMKTVYDCQGSFHWDWDEVFLLA